MVKAIKAIERPTEVETMSRHRDPTDISIDRPMHPPFHPERLRECQDAVVGALTKLMDDAEAAGWTITEITLAISALADEVMLNEVDVEQTNFILSRLFERRG